MLTLLCSPKPFVDEAAWNQLNALRSWRDIHSDVEIFVFGAPLGAAEAAAEVGATLVSEIETSSSGAPSFNAMVAYADRNSRHDSIVYANCDILLNGTLVHAIQIACRHFEQFLLVGERLDLAQDVLVDVREVDWTRNLCNLAARNGLAAHGPTGADYFGFRRHMWSDLPPVFMGRAMCDQALIHHCFQRQIPVIDGTIAVVNVHQYHGYQHLKGGQTEVFSGKDRMEMARAHRLRRGLPTIADADYQLSTPGKIEPKRLRMLRKAELTARYRYRADRIALVLRALQYFRGRHLVSPSIISAEDILAAWLRNMES